MYINVAHWTYDATTSSQIQILPYIHRLEWQTIWCLGYKKVLNGKFRNNTMKQQKKGCAHPKNYEVYLKGHLNFHCHIALITNNSHIQAISIPYACSSSLPTWSTANQEFSNRLRERVWIMAMHPQFKHRYGVAPLLHILTILTLRDLVSFWITTNHLDPSTQEENYTCDTQKHRAPLIFN